MGKVEVNNEVVLMRHAVRQARVRVVHKLTREIQLLRKRHGDEKQLEKFKKKADKLVEEICALKKIKDDDVSKFGINNKKTLQEILTDTSADASTRILARVVFHKILKEQIDAFKTKFPDYEKHLGPGKKKAKGSKKSNRKDVTALKKASKSENLSNNSKQQQNDDDADEPSKDIQNDNHVDMETGGIEEINESHSLSDENDSISNGVEPGSILRIKPASTESESEQSDCEEFTAPPIKKKKKEMNKDDNTTHASTEGTSKKDESNLLKKETVKSVKVVSKEATVKRFTEILQEETGDDEKSLQKGEEIKNKDSSETLQKEVDDFFMTGDGNNAYLSVSVPKIKTDENNLPETDLNPDNISRQQRHARKFDERLFSKGRKTTGFPDKRNGKMDQHQRGRPGKNQAPFERNPKRTDFPWKSAKHNNDTKSVAADNEKLHPSWAAKKKQQEMIKQGFQGKKIVFGDD